MCEPETLCVLRDETGSLSRGTKHEHEGIFLLRDLVLLQELKPPSTHQHKSCVLVVNNGFTRWKIILPKPEAAEAVKSHREHFPLILKNLVSEPAVSPLSVWQQPLCGAETGEKAALHLA